MAMEELIVAWSKERPAWQREVMRRVATGDVLSDDDYDRLVDVIVSEEELPAPPFGLAQLPQAASEGVPVCLVAIENTEHVNALESSEPLTFEARGLTVVYGDNGSGKSGYARLLKRITRARDQEDVLTDVFRDTAVAQPTAVLSVRIGDGAESLNWPESSRPDLQRMLFYDAACGNAYVASESDFPYRPSALFVMDGLIKACIAVRVRIDARLVDNSAAANKLPAVPEQTAETDAGRFLSSLAGSSSVEGLDALIKQFDKSPESIDELRVQEASLRNADTTKARQRLNRQSEKLEALRKHLEYLDTVLGSVSLAELQQRREALAALEGASALLARSFESEPLPGTGSSPWTALWDAARRFSKEYAYTAHEFPFLGEECRCVLCQQPLRKEAQERFTLFEKFVSKGVQTRLQKARRVHDQQVGSLRGLAISSEAVTSNLKDLDATHQEAASETREILRQYEILRTQTLEILTRTEGAPQHDIDAVAVITRLTEGGDAAKAAAEDLASPEGVQKRLAALTLSRVNLELLEQVKMLRPAIVKEIARLKEREILDAAKSSAATTGITKKILEFSEESITEVVRDTFTRETDRLRLERVTLTRTRADKGALLHQPKLVGARQKVTLPRVFSEGERTALGLAAFFTEANLDGSRSAIILDDPVTSLDHIRRGLVAARLAALAENRQVVLFTHDVAFVADLKREAGARDVLVAERSVTRSRADERKPGVCSTKHPWKAKDVRARLDELRKEIGRLKRECNTWDDKQYEEAVAVWAGNLSETWERIFSQEVVGPILAEGGLEVRPMMVKVLARFSDEDHREFEASYSRASQWVKRHDKSGLVNYVAPEIDQLGQELDLVDTWFKRVRGYKS